MARRAKMTERGCYTLTKPLKAQLKQVADQTGIAESKHIRRALRQYFEDLEKSTNLENSNYAQSD